MKIPGLFVIRRVMPADTGVKLTDQMVNNGISGLWWNLAAPRTDPRYFEEMDRVRESFAPFDYSPEQAVCDLRGEYNGSSITGLLTGARADQYVRDLRNLNGGPSPRFPLIRLNPQTHKFEPEDIAGLEAAQKELKRKALAEAATTGKQLDIIVGPSTKEPSKTSNPYESTEVRGIQWIG